MPHHPTAQHKSGLPYSRLSGGTGGGNRSSFGGVLPKQPMACTPMTTTTSALPPFAAATMASATSVPKAPPLGTLSPASQQLTAGRQPEGLTSGLPLKKSVAVLPTPAHVQAVMMAHDNENNEAPLDNTPRQATSALPTLMMGLEDEGALDEHQRALIDAYERFEVAWRVSLADGLEAVGRARTARAGAG